MVSTANVAPSVVAFLDQLRGRYLPVDDGELASYIPELAAATPDLFGIALVTVDGHLHEVGDSRHQFTIQSISKPFTHALALEARGCEAVRSSVGVEPTGDAFNSIVLGDSGIPSNPMVNAGAITIAGMLAAVGGGEHDRRVLDMFGRLAGRPLVIDEQVFASEAATGFRNRAIAHLLRSVGALEVDPDVALESYFEQCSVLVDSADLAMMAAVLANGGVHPLEGERVLRIDTVREVLTVMASCGMYDGAGAWMVEVGLPAKSGVSGAVIAVLPGQFGLAVFSPRLDARGNSVRGLSVCRDLSRELEVHLVAPGHRHAEPVRRAHRLGMVHSTRQRDESERERLRQEGSSVLIAELQGTVDFHAMEHLLAQVENLDPPVDSLMVDLRWVHQIEPAAQPFLLGIVQIAAGRRGAVVMSSYERHREVVDRLAASVRSEQIGEFHAIADRDDALEWFEQRVLGASPSPRRVELADHEVLRGLDPDQLAKIEAVSEFRTVSAGETLLRPGDPSDELWLVLAGHLSVYVAHSPGRERRLASVGAGSVIGELGMIGGRPANALVRADADTDVLVISADAARVIGREDPQARVILLQNLLSVVVGRVDQLRREISLLS